jgi:16S rRNA (guanine966-N2)-methyltransferase
VRIVAGRWRGRRLVAPKGGAVRPTADRVREAWMSIVQPALPGARVLDLFSGSGALGLEAISRGAEHADLVERAAPSLRAMAANIDTLGATEHVTVHRTDALRFIGDLRPHDYDVAFADPPYDLGLATAIAQAWLATPFADLIGIEHRIHEKLPAGGETRRYGGTGITFFRVA